MALTDTIAQLSAAADSAVGRRRTLTRQVVAQLRRGLPAGGSLELRLPGEAMRFTPNRIEAKVGVPLTVTLTNRGPEGHDLNVESIMEPGETRTIKLLFDAPGTHTFICTLPGHAEAGMTGAPFVTP